MLISVLLIALAPLTTPAPFADYVLNVPIRIENMHLSSATLHCDIYHIGAEADRFELSTPGTGLVEVPLSGGAYSGTLTVTVTVSAAMALQHPPTTWMCNLAYRWLSPEGTEYLASFVTQAQRQTAYTTMTGQEIVEATTNISGPLPPA